jgi:type IX secretion system PorP/SprF family membrane protein
MSIINIFRKHRLALAVLIITLISESQIYAQDPLFTQFYANPLYLNPAMAGSHICPRFSANYRNQWPSLSGNFVTQSFSYDQKFKAINGGIGIIALHDQQGQNTIQTSSLALQYSYHLKVTRNFTLMFGGQANFVMKFLDWNKLTFGDMIDPRRGFIYQTGDVPRGGRKGFLDMSAGIVGFTKQFYFGVAVHHLNRPNESMIIGRSPLPMRFTAHAGAEIPLGKSSKYGNKVSISPNILFRYQQGFMEMNVGTYVKYDMFTFGAWLRNRDAFILLLGIQMDKFKIGYSYDITVSKLTNQSGGAHEISLGVNLKCKDKKLTFRTISCPSF